MTYYFYRNDVTLTITKGQEIIGEEQTRIESELKYFLNNSDNHQRLYDVHSRFLEFNPEFRLIGVDFNDTDKNRVEEMKTIMRQYVEFYDEQVFDRKDASYSSILNRIRNLENDIKDFPTYYGRCYLLPLLRTWRSVITLHFEEVERVSQPNLRIIKAAKCSRYGNQLEAHLQISNREGKSSASGVKVWLLPSKNEEYSISQECYTIRGTLREGQDVTVPVSIIYSTTEPALTLNCYLTYMSRQGTEVPIEIMTVSLRIEEDTFEEEISNPYAPWANGTAVTDDEMFKGRDKLVNTLVELLQDERQKRMIVIYGQKRTGKSSILYHVGCDITFPAVAVSFSLGRIAMNLTVESLFYSLAHELYKVLAGIDGKLVGSAPDRTQFQMDAFGEFAEYVERLLNSFRQQFQFAKLLPVLILDEFTYIYQGIQEGKIDRNFMRAWKALVEKKFFSFLLSGIDEMPDFINSYPNEFAMSRLERVSYLDDAGARELIERPIWNERKNASRFHEGAVRRIMELTAKSAYYIQIFNNELVTYMNDERTRTGYITEADVTRVLENLITPGKSSNLNLASNFDNLTRLKTGIILSEEVELEGLLLRVIAFLTKNQEFASRQAVLSQFASDKRVLIDSLIGRLINREVLSTQAGREQYAIRVELFKHWLNANIPYRESEYESF